MITVSAFGWVPDFAQGLVRDLRVRWALEEAGLPYRERLLGLGEHKGEAYRRLQPFGQVPTYEEDGLVLFESGAIVLHIARRSEALMPDDAALRARVTSWMFAALNSIEPSIAGLVDIDLFHPDEEWAKLRRPAAVAAVRERLAELSAWLRGREYLEDRFTAGDLMMTTVLRILRHTDLVTSDPVLEPYRQRCEARPAFQKALADQLAPFASHAPADLPAA
jgi:glutathione S-transferase